MEKEEVAKAPEKIQWWWIIPIAVMPFVGSGCTLFLTDAVSNIFDLGKMGYLLYFNGATLLLYFFLTIISVKAPGKFRLSTSTIAYLYAAVAIATFFGNQNFPRHTFRLLLGARSIDAYKLAASYMPPWWMISKGAVKAFLEPGPVSPEWGLVILYWWSFASSLWFLIAGISIFLRRQWIDVENLPYPYAQVALVAARTAWEPARPQTKKLLISAPVGMLVFLPVIMRLFFPWFPDIYGWFSPTHDPGYVSLRIDYVWPAMFKSAVGLTWLCYNPLYVALAFFMPLSTLFSATFFYIAYILIGTQIAWYMGYYTGIENVAAGTRADMLRHLGPINITAFIEHGLLGMIVVMAVVLNWRSVIARPLRLALGVGAESEKEIEMKEPVSYRTALIIIIVSVAIILSLLMVSGFPADDAFIYLGMACVIQLSFVRARGFGGPVPTGDRLGPLFFRWKYPNVTIDKVPSGFYLFGQSAHYVASSNTPLGDLSYPIFETWRVGADLGVNYKNLFKIMCTAGLIAPLFGFLGFVVVGSTLGLSHTNKPSISDGTSFGIPSYVYTRPSPPHVWPWLVSGALLAVFLSYMRFRFVWWPLDPVGAFIGCGGPGVKIGLGWVFIIAFVIKYIVLKVGGSKMYSDTGVPIATGFIAGYTIMGVVGMIIGSIIFLRPI